MGRHSTVELFVFSSDYLLLILKILSTFYCKTSCLNEEVNCTEPAPSVSIPWLIHNPDPSGSVVAANTIKLPSQIRQNKLERFSYEFCQVRLTFRIKLPLRAGLYYDDNRSKIVRF